MAYQQQLEILLTALRIHCTVHTESRKSVFLLQGLMQSLENCEQ